LFFHYSEDKSSSISLMNDFHAKDLSYQQPSGSFYQYSKQHPYNVNHLSSRSLERSNIQVNFNKQPNLINRDQNLYPSDKIGRSLVDDEIASKSGSSLYMEPIRRSSNNKKNREAVDNTAGESKILNRIYTFPKNLQNKKKGEETDISFRSDSLPASQKPMNLVNIPMQDVGEEENEQFTKVGNIKSDLEVKQNHLINQNLGKKYPLKMNIPNNIPKEHVFSSQKTLDYPSVSHFQNDLNSSPSRMLNYPSNYRFNIVPQLLPFQIIPNHDQLMIFQIPNQFKFQSSGEFICNIVSC
jgi:hypothetical protein